MSANVRYWRSVERGALKELEAAKTRTALSLAARQLMLARTKVLELTGEWIEQGQSCYNPPVRPARKPATIFLSDATEATAQQRREVEQLAGALFEEQQALQARQRLLDEGRSLGHRPDPDRHRAARGRDPEAERAAGSRRDRSGHLRQAVEEANEPALRSSQAWADGATRFLQDYVAESQDAATATERAFAMAFGGAEDALVGFVSTGRLELQSLADSVLADLARMTVRQAVTAPLAGALQGAWKTPFWMRSKRDQGRAMRQPIAMSQPSSRARSSSGSWLSSISVSAGRVSNVSPLAFQGGDLFGLFHAGGVAGERPRSGPSL